MNIVTFKIDGNTVTRTLDNREFRDKENKDGKLMTGRKGFGSYGKVEINGKRYQLSLNMVEIQS